MNQFSRDNHYIPQFYLKQWSTGDLHHVWEYKLLVSHENVPDFQLVSIKGSTGWQRDLYTGLIRSKETDEIEHWFANEIEHPAQYVMEKIENCERISNNEMKSLVRFVAAQHVRTPAAYFRAKSIFENCITNVISRDTAKLTHSAAKYIVQSNDDKKYTRYSKWLPVKLELLQADDEYNKLKIQFTTGFTRNAWHFMNQNLLENTYNCMIEHDWRVIKVPPGVELYTSDDPAVFLNYTGRHDYNFNGGWGCKNGNAFFPISPSNFLFTEMGNGDIGNFVNTNIHTLTYWMQKVTIENAFRSIYLVSKNDNILLCRSRNVNADAYNHEKTIWKEWNKIQAEFESEFR